MPSPMPSSGPSMAPTVTTQPLRSVVELTAELMTTPGDLLVYSELAVTGISPYEVLSSDRIQNIFKTSVSSTVRALGMQGSVDVYLTYVGPSSRGLGGTVTGTTFIEYAVYRHSSTEADKQMLQAIMQSQSPYFYTDRLLLELRESLDKQSISVDISDSPVSEYVPNNSGVGSSSTQQADEDGLSDTATALVVILVLAVLGVVGFASYRYFRGQGYFEVARAKFMGLLGRTSDDDNVIVTNEAGPE